MFWTTGSIQEYNYAITWLARTLGKPSTAGLSQNYGIAQTMTPLFSNPTDISSPLSPERLAEVTEGDHAFECQLLRVFLEDMEQRFAHVTTAIIGNDYKTILLEFHSIKGAAGNVGAYPLRTAAELGEAAARAEHVENIASAFETMKAQFLRLRDTIQARLSP